MNNTTTIILAIFLSTKILLGQTNGDTKIFGQAILDGKMQAADDIRTFRTLDSLRCKNKADKIFYFKVANKICQTSDGALSEYVSAVFSDYYFLQTSEFLANSETLNKTEIYKWLDLIAYDLYADSKNGEKDLPSIMSKLTHLEKKCPRDKKATLKIYNDYLYQMAEHYLQSD